MAAAFPHPLIEAVRTAENIAALTGAGVSAESGVPTFREAQTGLWAQYKPEQLATRRAFRANPERVWAWYQWRRRRVAAVQPNPGHEALAQMESHLRLQNTKFTLITQNVDGLHQQAGSQQVIELHGNIRRTKCFQCEAILTRWQARDQAPPRCPNCGGRLRPDVVWFGESLPAEALDKAVSAAQRCQVFFSIGTSALVQPAASLPLLALDAGALVVEINPNATPITPQADFVLRGPSGEILPRLVAAIWA
jgi:NAD-dependent deacetylase